MFERISTQIIAKQTVRKQNIPIHVCLLLELHSTAYDTQVNIVTLAMSSTRVSQAYVSSFLSVLLNFS